MLISNKLYIVLFFLSAFTFCRAQGDNKIDTLFLNDNTVITGQIENLYQVITIDGSAAKRDFKIDTAWGKRIEVPVRDIKYIGAFGTRFEHVVLHTGAHQLLEIIDTGKLTLYLWRKLSVPPGSGMVNTFNDNKIFKPATGITTESEIETYMLLAKDKWYSIYPAFLKNKFTTLFGDCPKLVQEAKSKDFNYKAIGKTVKEYNRCF